MQQQQWFPIAAMALFFVDVVRLLMRLDTVILVLRNCVRLAHNSVQWRLSTETSRMVLIGRY